jgi:hypothetical protein
VCSYANCNVLMLRLFNGRGKKLLAIVTRDALVLMPNSPIEEGAA